MSINLLLRSHASVWHEARWQLDSRTLVTKAIPSRWVPSGCINSIEFNTSKSRIPWVPANKPLFYLHESTPVDLDQPLQICPTTHMGRTYQSCTTGHPILINWLRLGNLLIRCTSGDHWSVIKQSSPNVDASVISAKAWTPCLVLCSEAALKLMSTCPPNCNRCIERMGSFGL